MKRSFFGKLIAVYACGTVLCMVCVALFWSKSYRDEHYARLEQVLAARAVLVAELARREPGEAGSSLKAIANRIDTRVTLISPAGAVQFDSMEEASRMDNHLDRPEVMAATASGRGTSIRRSGTLNEEMMYYCAAQPGEGGKPAGYVRLAFSTTSVRRSIRRVYLAIWSGTAVATLAALGGGAFLLRRITRPLTRLQESAERLKSGDLETPIRVDSRDEISLLGESLERMRTNLREVIGRYGEAAGRLEALLAWMSGGVVATDEHDVVVFVNDEARRLLRLPPDATGRRLSELVRDRELLDLMQESHRLEQPRTEHLTLLGAEERFVQARIAPVHDAARKFHGAVAVLVDVTELRRLERVRSDFVANVSHELKSPLTSIRGFVETLHDGGCSPEETRRFLAIVEQEAERLENLITDLLSLSEIEAERAALSVAPVDVNEVARSAAQRFGEAAAQQGLAIDLKLASGLPLVPADENLLGQAFGNLVDNAVKYNRPGGSITLETAREGGSVLMRVHDTGIGIPSKDVPRVFERFYRVDKSHSRRLGGTGLGLSIAKHIAAAHGGGITLESELGKGSVFSLFIPSSTIAS